MKYTCVNLFLLGGNASLLSWERGLKFLKYHDTFSEVVVAPLVGAWIEILRMLSGNFCQEVAPLVGAWIEIIIIFCLVPVVQSLLSWERGLKLMDDETREKVHRRSSRGSVD